MLATGVSMTGAMSVKLIGVVSALTTLYSMTLNLWTLAQDKSINAVRFIFCSYNFICSLLLVIRCTNQLNYAHLSSLQ